MTEIFSFCLKYSKILFNQSVYYSNILVLAIIAFKAFEIMILPSNDKIKNLIKAIFVYFILAVSFNHIIEFIIEIPKAISTEFDLIVAKKKEFEGITWTIREAVNYLIMLIIYINYIIYIFLALLMSSLAPFIFLITLFFNYPTILKLFWFSLLLTSVWPVFLIAIIKTQDMIFSLAPNSWSTASISLIIELIKSSFIYGVYKTISSTPIGNMLTSGLNKLTHAGMGAIIPVAGAGLSLGAVGAKAATGAGKSITPHFKNGIKKQHQQAKLGLKNIANRAGINYEPKVNSDEAKSVDPEYLKLLNPGYKPSTNEVKSDISAQRLWNSYNRGNYKYNDSVNNQIQIEKTNAKSKGIDLEQHLHEKKQFEQNEIKKQGTIKNLAYNAKQHFQIKKDINIENKNKHVNSFGKKPKNKALSYFDKKGGRL
ncbi:MAG: hypothetical protein MK008_09775 [Bdellovibrionales bacterium]|nr:hypothetical protein [Bdellovibrionales bacterium]